MIAFVIGVGEDEFEGIGPSITCDETPDSWTPDSWSECGDRYESEYKDMGPSVTCDETPDSSSESGTKSEGESKCPHSSMACAETSDSTSGVEVPSDLPDATLTSSRSEHSDSSFGIVECFPLGRHVFSAYSICSSSQASRNILLICSSSVGEARTVTKIREMVSRIVLSCLSS